MGRDRRNRFGRDRYTGKFIPDLDCCLTLEAILRPCRPFFGATGKRNYTRSPFFVIFLGYDHDFPASLIRNIPPEPEARHLIAGGAASGSE